jgi:hypothetical protein
MMMKLTDVLEVTFKQRAYDGKWERLIRIIDYDNTYSYKNEQGIQSSITPTKWVTSDVYDLELDIIA